jgi:Flp pilus assembly protein TadD
MKYSRYTTLAATAVLTATISLIGGCNSDGQMVDRPRSNPIQDEFAAGKDRVPTAETLYAMSRILVARNRDAKAEFVLVRIIEQHPGFIPAYNELAELRMRNDRTDEAITSLEAGLAIAPDQPVLLNNLGVCAMVSEDYESAVTHFLAAMDAAPNVARYQANLGVAMALMGDYDGAYEVMLGVLGEYDARTNLAQICLANGDEERAAEELRLAEESLQ